MVTGRNNIYLGSAQNTARTLQIRSHASLIGGANMYKPLQLALVLRFKTRKFDLRRKTTVKVVSLSSFFLLTK